MRLNYIRLFSFCLLSALVSCAPLFGGSSTTVVDSKVRAVQAGTEVLLTQQPQIVEQLGPQPAPKAPALSDKRFLAFPAHVGPVNALVADPRGEKAYSGGQDGRVLLFQAVQKGGHRIFERSVLMEGNRPVLALSLSHDGRRLAVAQYSSVTIYDLPSRKVVATMTRVLGRILALAWDPRSEFLAFGRANGDVHVWNLSHGWYAGEDNDNALEAYQGATSPIVALRFHPSGRAFFAAERDGGVNLWRVLRTERELGLRDEAALVDKQRKGRRVIRVAQIPAQIEQMWVSEHGEDLYISATDGNAYNWKIRGLQPGIPLTVGTDAVTALTGTLLPIEEGKRLLPSLVSAGRGQKVAVWCRAPVDRHIKRPFDVLIVDEDFNMGDPIEPPLPGEEIPEIEAPSSAVLVAESPVFREPVTLLANGITSPLIWAAQQGGALVVIDTEGLDKLPGVAKRAQDCFS